MFSNAFIMPKKPYIDVYCFCVVQMEDLYPIVEEGPKYRGKQSIKLRVRFEPQGDGLNAQFKHRKNDQKIDFSNRFELFSKNIP